MPRLGPLSRCCDHPRREEATEGLLEEMPGIPTAATPHELQDSLRRTESCLQGAGDNEAPLAQLDERQNMVADKAMHVAPLDGPAS